MIFLILSSVLPSGSLINMCMGVFCCLALLFVWPFLLSSFILHLSLTCTWVCCVALTCCLFDLCLFRSSFLLYLINVYIIMSVADLHWPICSETVGFITNRFSVYWFEMLPIGCLQ